MKSFTLLSTLITIPAIVAFCVPKSTCYRQNFIPSTTTSSSRSSVITVTSIRSLSTDNEVRLGTIGSPTSSSSSSSINIPLLRNGTSALPTTTTIVGAATTTTTSSIPTRNVSFEPSYLLQSQQQQQQQLDSMTSSSSSSSSLFVWPDWVESVGWRAVIVVLCAVWASNFAVAKLVMAEPGVDSSLYAVSRFGVAATALAPFAINHLKRANMDWETLKSAIICGSWVAFGYLGQTLGLLTTTASKSCVICSMHCVFVAVVAEYWRVQNSPTTTTTTTTTMEDGSTVMTTTVIPSPSFDVRRLLPAAIAVVGVAIVELHGAGGAPTIGDALSFAQPVGFGMGYLLLENIMAKNPDAALPVSAIKLAVVAVASFLMFELTPVHMQGSTDLTLTVPDFSAILSSPIALGGILYTGLITTALALWVESIAFAKVPATDASLILTTEPLFAAGCGALALGETFGMSDYVGAGLIVGACALSIFMGESSHHQTSGEGTEGEEEGETTVEMMSREKKELEL